MSCGQCGTWNAEDEHRCRRCGRRLQTAHPIAGNLATALAPARERQPTTDDASPGSQAWLFGERPPANVIPMPQLAIVPKLAARPAAGLGNRKPATTRAPDAQPKLDFLPPAPLAPRTLGTTVEAVIFCDAPVATPTHRLVAGLLDFANIVIGYALFLLTFRLAGGEFELNRLNLIIFGSAFAILAMFYGLIWALGNAETPGMYCTRLRLTNFDGFPPEPSQRALRFLGTCLSIATGGIGLLWALVDEESLTWQDHISKTFSTFREPDTNFVRRR